MIFETSGFWEKRGALKPYTLNSTPYTKSNRINSKKPANCLFGQDQALFAAEFDIPLEIIVVPVLFHWPIGGIDYVCRSQIVN